MKHLFSTVIAACHQETKGYDWDNRARPSDGKTLVLQQVLKGQLLFEVAGEVATVGQGDAFVFAHREASRYWIDLSLCDFVEIRYATFCDPPDGMSAASLRQRFGQVFALPASCEPAARLQQLIDAYWDGLLSERFLNSRMSYDVLMSLLSWSSREAGILDMVTRAREWLMDNHTRHVGVKELAYEMGVSREHITRAFRRRYDETPGAMLDRLRLARAEQLLRLDHLSIHEVARKSGFAHADTLARHCKAVHGRSPAQLRKGRAPGHD